MWSRLATFILRGRLPILLVLLAVTAGMASRIDELGIRYKFGGLLPADDPVLLDYASFLDEFGEEGNVVALGIQDARLDSLQVFQQWWDLDEALRQVQVPVDSLRDDGTPWTVNVVDSVFGFRTAVSLVRQDDPKAFVMEPIIRRRPETQAELDSVMGVLRGMPFYEGFLHTDLGATIQMVYVNAPLFNSENRGRSVELLVEEVERFEKSTGLDVHVSGLPYIRTEVTTKIKRELGLFIGLAAFVTALLLLLFFRNIVVMMVCMMVVGTGVICSLGSIVLFDYKLTALMGLIPPLMIVIGVPNCIYLLNKYHAEFKRHGNKALALTRMVKKVGNATFMTNATTALGFAAFMFTTSDVLQQFGVIASVNILAMFCISLLIIPAVFSWLPPPRRRHVSHLDRRWVFLVVHRLERAVSHHRKWVYVFTLCVLALGGLGISMMKVTGNIAGDLPQEDVILADLNWFEDRFGGVMPFEVVVQTNKPGKVTQLAFLKKVERLQEVLAEEPQLSRSVSLVDGLKLAKQGFFQGNPARYSLPSRREQSFMGPYLSGTKGGGIEGDGKFVDSARTKIRVSAQVADIGTREMNALTDRLQLRIDSIFPPEDHRVFMTGTSVVFVEGTTYLVKNLLVSLMLAVLVIATVMSILFRSARMVAISLLPNLVPLIFTAAVMGYFGIALKPSTLLVFSIAFGISVDDTIHLLAKYRQELDLHGWNMREAVLLAVRETGVSMMYTSIVLFFGFLMFFASDFEGTRALGILVSTTLLVAMLTNLVLLPSMLLGLERYITAQTFKEPLLEIIDEEEDVDLAELEVMEGIRG
ncbi:MAG: efflux RND transporter permease subunit [Flavobacteriales bacterium]|nr:efflux RND transporter permease subunit [Flavobacteriales bacterium]